MNQIPPEQPVLYSFRRCPYAMRARLALHFANQAVEHREVVLKDIPQQMIDISPKATVPVMQLPDGTVIDESLDIALWALEQQDPSNLLGSLAQLSDMLSLINDNDNDFKGWLDQYKYADRYPEQTPEYYREQGEVFLKKLENRLSHHPFLFGIKMRLADIAIMPFVRQFAHVDKKWFEAADYPFLQNWLQAWLESDDFQKIMFKYLKWTG
jgi:glutathione S-transferase